MKGHVRTEYARISLCHEWTRSSIVKRKTICNFERYDTAQFKLDKARVWHVLDTTCFFISHACRHACVRKIDDVETLVQSTRVCTRRVAEARVHFRHVHAKSGLRAPWRVYEL